MQFGLKELRNYINRNHKWWAQGGFRISDNFASKSNSRPSRCKRDVITTKPWALTI